MYCKTCGNLLRSTDSVCNICGSPVSRIETMRFEETSAVQNQGHSSFDAIKWPGESSQAQPANAQQSATSQATNTPQPAATPATAQTSVATGNNDIGFNTQQSATIPATNTNVTKRKFDFNWNDQDFRRETRKTEDIEFKWGDDAKPLSLSAAISEALRKKEAEDAAAQRQESAAAVFEDDTFHLRTNPEAEAQFQFNKKNEEFQELLDQEFERIQERQYYVEEERNRINSDVLKAPVPTPESLVSGDDVIKAAEDRVAAFLARADMEMLEAIERRVKERIAAYDNKVNEVPSPRMPEPVNPDPMIDADVTPIFAAQWNPAEMIDESIFAKEPTLPSKGESAFRQYDENIPHYLGSDPATAVFTEEDILADPVEEPTLDLTKPVEEASNFFNESFVSPFTLETEDPQLFDGEFASPFDEDTAATEIPAEFPVSLEVAIVKESMPEAPEIPAAEDPESDLDVLPEMLKFEEFNLPAYQAVNIVQKAPDLVYEPISFPFDTVETVEETETATPPLSDESLVASTIATESETEPFTLTSAVEQATEPVVPTNTAEPISEPVIPSIAVEPTTEPLIIPTIATEQVIEPITPTVAVEPVTPTIAVEPATEPVTPTVAVKPATEPSTPAVETIAEPPIAPTVTVEPATKPVVTPLVEPKPLEFTENFAQNFEIPAAPPDSVQPDSTTPDSPQAVSPAQSLAEQSADAEQAAVKKSARKKSGPPRAVVLLVDILIVIAVLILCGFAVLKFAPDSGLGELLIRAIYTLTHLGS